MQMLVDAEKVLEWFKSSLPGFSLKDCVVDAVPVVRCKDCEFARYAGFGTITGNKAYRCVNVTREGCSQVLDANDYCSYGYRRKENAQIG